MENHESAEVGLILMDLSLNVLAFDRGAVAILGTHNQVGVEHLNASQIPKEILDGIRARKALGSWPFKLDLRLGHSEYACRTHMVEFHGFPSRQPVLAVHIERRSSMSDAIYQAGVKYNLTEREQQALRGILMGWTAKEVADRMNISPNTVKAFLRLIMIKMGVATRAAVVAKIFQSQTAASAERPAPGRSELVATAAVGSLSRGGGALARRNRGR